MKKLGAFVLSGAIACACVPALAQFAKADDAIKYRQSSFFILQQHFSRLVGMASGKVPFDAKVAAENAAAAEFVGKLPWAAYGPGMDQGKSRSKPEIWTDKAKYDELANKMQAELARLSAAVQAGDQNGLKAAVAAVGDTCKSCHSDFRSK